LSAEVINLRRARKASARAERQRAAEQNRRLHGQTKGEKEKQAAERERQRKEIAGHRIAREDD
jgi:hypothetical protein